jgi:hypothetical protein
MGRAISLAPKLGRSLGKKITMTLIGLLIATRKKV